MQPNTLTLSVDVANNSTIVEQDYERFEEHQNRSVYVGENHRIDNRDMITVYRSFPTRTGNFQGTAKTSAKFTDDVTVSGVDVNTSVKAPMICEVSFSIPVGTDPELVLEMRQRVIALLDQDSFMDSLNLRLMV